MNHSHSLKALLALTALLLLPLARAAAADFEATAPTGQTLRFRTTQGGATVLGLAQADSVGRLVLPDAVAYGGTTYAVDAIAMRAFANCSTLTAVVIPEGVRQVGSMAFLYCSALDSLSLPSTLTTIGTSAFAGTAFAQDSTLWHDGLLVVDGYLLGMDGQRVDTVVALAEGVQGVAGFVAGTACGIVQRLELPSSLRFISDMAFSGCTGLDTLAVHATVPPALGHDVFTPEGMQVVVPCEAYEAYAAATRWADLNLVECTPVVGIDVAAAVRPVARGERGGIVVDAPCRVIDIMGRPMAASGLRAEVRMALPKGIYIVLFEEGAVKVSVR